MRKTSSNIKTILSGGGVGGFLLLKLITPSITYYHTSAPFDINISGLGTFISNNNLISVEAPKLSNIVDRSTYKVSYTDPDFSFRGLFDNGLVGSSIEIYIGFYNSTDTILGSALPGEPLLDFEDIIPIYIGIVDSHGYSTTQDNEVIMALECSSPMANLNMTKAIFTSQDSIRQVNPNDTAFDQVFVGAKAVNFLWGKA
jgi:hypothetical protein